ncbi:hypothetical protein [Eubacterium xylanophilum]|uniref:hypothetical protein n=1 Tax=Eubacterium xylanophilum TaxID=39497 RepID=UPI00047A4A5D|nr:hypothetical protein [Eubacterium xylanophilum]
MSNQSKKMLSIVLAGAVVLGSLGFSEADAAKKVKLSAKKLSIKVGKTKTLKVKNAKKAKWSIRKGKKYIQLKSKKKKSVKIKAKKFGTAVVAAKVGKKTYLCNVSVLDPTAISGKPSATPTAAGQTIVNITYVTGNTPDPNAASTAGPVAEPVKDVTIDMSKVNAKTFYKAGYVYLDDQLPDKFDMSYFSSCEVGFELKFKEGGDQSKLTNGKLALVNDVAMLDGMKSLGTDSQPVAGGYVINPGLSSATLSLSGVTGRAVGLNVQPMDSNANYSWPESLYSITITSIKFKANPSTVYPEGAPVATRAPFSPAGQEAAPAGDATPAPTEAPKTKVTDIDVDLTGVTSKFSSNGKTLDFGDKLPANFDVKLFKSIEVSYKLNLKAGEDGSDIGHGKVGVACRASEFNGYSDGQAMVDGLKPGAESVSITIPEDIDGTKVLGFNIQMSQSDWSKGWPTSLESVEITGVKFIAKEDAYYEN